MGVVDVHYEEKQWDDRDECDGLSTYQPGWPWSESVLLQESARKVALVPPPTDSVVPMIGNVLEKHAHRPDVREVSESVPFFVFRFCGP